MIRALLLFPVQAASLAVFLYLVGGGWLVLSPGEIAGLLQ